MAYPQIITSQDLADAQSGDLDFFASQATAAVRAFCGWHVAPVVEEDLIIDTPRGAELLLPTMRLVEVLAATVDGEDVLPDLEWSAAGMLRNRRGWRRRYRGLSITIRHGFEIQDTPLVGLLAALTARAKIAPAGVVTQQDTAGPYTRQTTFATAKDGGTPGLSLMESERAQLAPYRLTWGV